jgi:hypothetical protein
VSAAVRFIPRPPALVLNKKTKMSDLHRVANSSVRDTGYILPWAIAIINFKKMYQ